jgi:uroporphyrin-3 C-methyltransferase
VRDTAKNALPLILPEEKAFLYQNLHAQMESAMWAVLQHNNDVYQASLARSLAWIQLYFDQEAAPTKNMLQNIAELQKTNIELKATNLSATLQLFDNYFAQTKAAS